jgi:hypothetical protein
MAHSLFFAQRDLDFGDQLEIWAELDVIAGGFQRSGPATPLGQKAVGKNSSSPGEIRSFIPPAWLSSDTKLVLPDNHSSQNKRPATAAALGQTTWARLLLGLLARNRHRLSFGAQNAHCSIPQRPSLKKHGLKSISIENLIPE